MLGTLLRPTDKELQQAVENNKRIAGFRWGTMVVSGDGSFIGYAWKAYAAVLAGFVLLGLLANA
jgi:hypothetical protein